MPRPQAPQPLLQASPTLQPTARPNAVQIGATPAPRSSPLMELARAFQEVNPELRDLLRDTAAREEQDAEALGEIEATRLRAEGRMAELDKVLKAKVDSGELSSVRLPAAQRAAALRTGHEHATIGLQSELFSRIPEAVKDGPGAAEKIAAEVFTKFSDGLPKGSFFERQGFDKAAQDVLSQFRYRVNQEQTAEAERYQKQKRADEGTDLVYQLGAAPDDLAPAAKERVKAYLDTIRGEMKKSEVNAFFAESVLKGAVARLVEERNYAAADQLLEETKALDLTGQGGLFGKTEDGSKAIYELSNLVESKRRTSRSEDADLLREQTYLASQTGLNEAAKDLFELRQANGGQLPASERQRVLDAARQRITDPLAYQSYVASFNGEYENEERWRSDPQTAAQLLAQVDTLDPQRLDEAEAQLKVALANRAVSASAYHEARTLIERNRQLVGAIKDSDVEAFQRAVFQVRGPLGGFTIDVGDDALIDKWDTLPEDVQTDVRIAATNNFVEVFRQNIRLMSAANPQAVDAIKAQAWDKASTAARAFTKSALLGATKTAQAQDVSTAVGAQATNLRRAGVVIPSRSSWATFMGNSRDPGERSEYTVRGDAPKGIKNAPVTRQAFVPKPGPDLDKAIEAQKALPQSEWDVVATPSWFYVTRVTQEALGFPRALDMNELAKEILAPGDAKSPGAGNPERAAIASRYYGLAKSLLGFTPDEIKDGKTKHGVGFTPSEVDYKSIPVFRSVSELEKEWNKGDFTPLFGEVGDAIDPQNKVHPEDFYLAQLALLSHRK